MKKEDLTTYERLLLKWCKMYPNFKYIEESRLRMNTLAAYKLVQFAGNLQYELTETGQEILNTIY